MPVSAGEAVVPPGPRRNHPVAFAVAADEAAWRRSANIVSAHIDDRIISIVTVHAPDRYAAVTLAHAVVSDALRHRAATGSEAARK